MQSNNSARAAYVVSANGKLRLVPVVIPALREWNARVAQQVAA